jgi:very-short-patch-repair endonuclease
METLKKSQLEGRKFRRQQSIGKYVVDFYCPKEMLAVELDGVYHFTEEGIEHDDRKTDFLNSLGIRVLRFENEKVFENIDAVLETIRLHFDQ